LANVRFVLEVDAAGGLVGIKSFQSALAGVGTTATASSNQATTAFDRMEKILGKARSAVIGMLSAFVVVNAIRALRELIDAGIAFEASFAGIRKTVEGSVIEFGRLQEQMRQLAKEVPINVNELNKIGEIAGQLGVPTQKIAEFTEVIAKIGLATTLSTEEAATGFARFAAIMDIPIDRIKTFASVVVRLGNEFPATEQEILSFSLNIAAAGKQVGLSEDKIAALATALASTGLRAEKAGSAMSRILIEMAKSVDTGGERLNKFAEIAGTSAEKFSKAFREDASKALIAFLGGLKAIPPEGESTFKVLEKLGLAEIRVRDVTLRASEAVGFFERALVSAKDEMGKAGRALDTEVAKRMQTTAAQLDLLVARLRDLAITASLEVAPALLSTASKIVNFVEATARLTKENQALIFAVIGVGAAFGSLAFLKWIAGFAAVKLVVVNLVVAFTSLLGFIASAEIAFGALVAALPTVAILGTVAAIFSLQKAWDDEAVAVENAAQAEAEFGRVLAKEQKALREAGFSMSQIRERGVASLREELDTRLWFEAAQQKILDRQRASQEQATEEYTKQVKKMTDSVTDAARNAGPLSGALSQLARNGTPATLVFEALGKSIDETVRQLKAMGKEIPKNIAQMAELQGLLKLGMMKPGENIEDRDTRDIFRTPDWLRTSPVLGPAPDIIGSMASDMEMLEQTLKGLETLRTGDALKVNIDITISDAAKKRADDTFKDLAKAAGQVFDAMIEKGFSGVGDVFKGIALTAARDMFSVFVADLLTPLKEKWTTLLRDHIAPVIKNITKSIGDSIKSLGSARGMAFMGGGAAIGGAAGGVRGSIVGAAGGAALSLLTAAGPTNWVGVAIAGVAAVGAALTGLFGKLRKQADKFVQEIQNPMTAAVTDLFNSLTAAKDAGTLTVAQVQQAKGAFEDMWTTFQAQAASAGIVGQQAMSTMTPFVASWREWLDSLEDAGAELERQAAIKEITSRVTDAAAGFEAMEGALAELVDSGMDWGPIVEFIGNDIKTLAERMKVLGMEIPPYMQALLDQMDANDGARKAAEAAAEAIRAHTEAVEEMVGRVANAAGGWTVMEEALIELQERGVPASQIIKFLGDDIVKMGDTMKAVGLEIPGAIQAFYNLAKAIERIGEVNKELKEVGDALEKEIIKKFDYLTSALEKSRKNIEGWTKELTGVTEDIDEHTKKLADAKFWQGEYDKAIKDTADNLKSLAEKRKSIEDRIQDLTLQVERDRLRAIVETSKDEKAVKDAEMALDAMDRTAKEKEISDRISELSSLRNELEETIRQQAEARIAHETASDAALKAIEDSKEETRQKLAASTAQKTALQQSISLENARVALLQEDIAATEALMKTMGIARVSELEQMNNTIQSLMARRDALYAERDALMAVVGAAGVASAALNGLLGNLAIEDTGLPSSAAQNTGIPTSPQATTGHEQPIGYEQPSAPLASARPYYEEGPFGRRYTPRYHMGTPYPVQQTGPAILERGEEVRPAHEAAKAGNSYTVVVNGNIIGNREYARYIAEEMDRLRRDGEISIVASEVRPF